MRLSSSRCVSKSNLQSMSTYRNLIQKVLDNELLGITSIIEGNPCFFINELSKFTWFNNIIRDSINAVCWVRIYGTINRIVTKYTLVYLKVLIRIIATLFSYEFCIDCINLNAIRIIIDSWALSYCNIKVKGCLYIARRGSS